MPQRAIRTRLSAKNLGKHVKAKDPWRSHAIVATISAALRPQRQQVQYDVGQRVTAAKYSRLELGFRKELGGLLARINPVNNNLATDLEPSSRFMKGVFRRFYTAAFLLGKDTMIGGLQGTARKMTPEDNKWLEAFLRKEYELWTKFMAQVRAGTTKMAPSRRVEMYVQTLRSMYNASKVLNSSPTALYHWETSPAEHCPQCLYLAQHGPYTKENIPTIPGSGDTVCHSNCKCHLRISHPSVVEYQRVKANSPTREELLKGMRALKR
jgi:hypothetical protein